jgi:hypothetical protein
MTPHRDSEMFSTRSRFLRVFFWAVLQTGLTPLGLVDLALEYVDGGDRISWITSSHTMGGQPEPMAYHITYHALSVDPIARRHLKPDSEAAVLLVFLP